MTGLCLAGQPNVSIFAKKLKLFQYSVIFVNRHKNFIYISMKIEIY